MHKPFALASMKSKNIIAIIPARYASTRFPGKPLVDINGKSMIQRVYEKAFISNVFEYIVVATDNDEILNHVQSWGGNALMTSALHETGTDRCVEALEQLKSRFEFDYVINIQGDEPFIAIEQIQALAAVLNGETEIATLCKKITENIQLFDPNKVKIVFDYNHNALYFSRQAIPYQRGIAEENWLHNGIYFKHLGLYAYKSDILYKISQLAVGDYEKAESLEQLRWLQNGYKIKVIETNHESIGIDTPEDLIQALKHLEN